MAACILTLRITIMNQPYVGFMNQGCGLQCLSAWFMYQLLDGKPAQFVVDQRQELSTRLPLTAPNGIQDVRDIIHDNQYRPPVTTVIKSRIEPGAVAVNSI